MIPNELEKLLIGSVLRCSNGHLDEIKNSIEILTPASFDGPAHPHIFSALKRCIEKGVSPNTANVAIEMKGLLDNAGGLEYLERLTQFPNLVGVQDTQGIGDWVRQVDLLGRARLIHTELTKRIGIPLEDFQKRVLEADDPEQYLAQLVGNLDSKFQPVRRKPLGSIGIEELDAYPDPEWVVENVLSTSGICILAGDGGHGKSWLTLALALSVASGRDWLGQFKVKRGPVIYIDQENPGSLIKYRRNLLMAGMGLKYEDLEPIRFILDKEIDFFPIVDRYSRETQRREVIDQLAEELKIWKPILLTVDSLRACHSGREDFSDDMRPVFMTIRKAAREANSDTGVFIPHHTNKGGSYRGSGDIKQAPDCLIEVVMSDSTITLEYKKLRSAMMPKPFEVELYSDGLQVDLKFKGAAPEKKESAEDGMGKWLSPKLSKNDMSRKEIVEQAEKDGIAKESKVDKFLKTQKDKGRLFSYMQGNQSIYTFDKPVKDEENPF